mmetsp:Transcript_64783/g.180293  ORF Transcript_64783/g.180293 Transcript_64783/m.180293 type:complete len:320 (+) Transcript_64783:226-1185(+)
MPEEDGTAVDATEAVSNGFASRSGTTAADVAAATAGSWRGRPTVVTNGRDFRGGTCTAKSSVCPRRNFLEQTTTPASVKSRIWKCWPSRTRGLMAHSMPGPTSASRMAFSTSWRSSRRSSWIAPPTRNQSAHGDTAAGPVRKSSTRKGTFVVFRTSTEASWLRTHTHGQGAGSSRARSRSKCTRRRRHVILQPLLAFLRDFRSRAESTGKLQIPFSCPTRSPSPSSQFPKMPSGSMERHASAASMRHSNARALRKNSATPFCAPALSSPSLRCCFPPSAAASFPLPGTSSNRGCRVSAATASRKERRSASLKCSDCRCR